MQLLLESRAATAIGRRGADASRWHDLIDRIDPRIRADGYWPQLASHLAQAGRSRPDLRTLLAAAAADGPLPDELPAAALWWRLAGPYPRPPWRPPTPNCARPGPPTCTPCSDRPSPKPSSPTPPGPRLVVAIGAADPTRWTPRDLLQRWPPNTSPTPTPTMAIAPYEYARLITYTVDLFTGEHPHHPDADIPVPDEAPLSPEDEENFAPDPHLTDTAPPVDPHVDDQPLPPHPHLDDAPERRLPVQPARLRGLPLRRRSRGTELRGPRHHPPRRSPSPLPWPMCTRCATTTSAPHASSTNSTGTPRR